ncbi:MAG TPA: BPSS1780 family membrane protein [Gallionellaceae bacterium]|nr:BPSS1780 family membrane protein [Gallionellaceae bacterium]
MNKFEIQKVPASHGWLWVKHGYRLIMRSPLQAFSLAMFFMLGVFLAMNIPHAGVLLAVLLMPILMAGYMRVCRSLEYNEKVEPRQIIAGFESRTAQLVTLGGMLLLGMIVVSMFTAAMGGSALSSILETFQTQQDPSALIDALLAPESGLRLTLLAGFALLFLLMLAMQFAPMLVFFNGMSPRHAMQVSLMASVRNILPFSVYSLIMQLIAFAVSVVPMGLGWIILVPIGLTSMYVAYRDIFSEVKAASDEKENG